MVDLRLKKLDYIFLNPFPGYGGLEIQMVKRAFDVISHGHNAIVLNLPGSKAEHYCRKLNVPSLPFKTGRKYFDILAIIKLGKIFKKLKPDICIVGKTELLNTAVSARNLYSKKTALILYQQMQSGVKKIDFFHNRLYGNLDGAIVIAEYMKHQLAANTVFPIEKIAIIPCGTNFDEFRPDRFKRAEVREKFGLPVDSLIIGCVGRIDPQKDQLTAIEAYAKANLENSRLIFAGNTDDLQYLQKLNQRATDLGISEKIVFFPFTEDIAELMNCFDIFVLPSLCETLGLVVIEAMAAELPVIATRSGGVTEIIKNEETGFFFEPRECSKLKEYLQMLASNSETREKIGKAARADTIARYGYKFLANQFIEYCNSVLETNF